MYASISWLRGDILGVRLRLIGLHLAASIENRLTVLVNDRALHGHTVKSKLDRLHQASLDTHLLPVGAHRLPVAVAVLGICLHNQVAASLGDVILFIANTLAALLKTLRSINEQHAITVLGAFALLKIQMYVAIPVL